MRMTGIRLTMNRPVDPWISPITTTRAMNCDFATLSCVCVCVNIHTCARTHTHIVPLDGDPAGAAQLLEACMAVNPHNAEDRVQLATARRRLNDRAAAAAASRQAVAMGAVRKMIGLSSCGN